MRRRATTALAAAGIVAAFAGFAPAEPSWTGNFETGNFSQYAPIRYCEADYSCQVVNRPVIEGRFAARFEVRPGDDYGHWSGERAQIALFRQEDEGGEAYWGWSVYLPRDYRDSRSFFQVFAEWHHSGLTGSPPVTFQIVRGRYVVRIVRSSDPARAIAWDQYDLGGITPGRWTRFIFHAHWSTNPGQAVNEIWVNGMLKQRVTGHPNLFTGYWNYLVLGWYRQAVAVTQVVYIDDVRVGGSLDALDAITGMPPTRLSARAARINAFAPARGAVAVIARDDAHRLLARRRILPATDGRISVDLKFRRPIGKHTVEIELRSIRGRVRPATLTLAGSH
jgi:hypothetical protein